MLKAPIETLFDVREVAIEVPDKARILQSIACAECGQPTMASRVRRFRGDPYCLPCFAELSDQQPAAESSIR